MTGQDLLVITLILKQISFTFIGDSGLPVPTAPAGSKAMIMVERSRSSCFRRLICSSRKRESTQTIGVMCPLTKSLALMATSFDVSASSRRTSG